LGQVCVIAGSYCPDGTVDATGQIMAIGKNQPLSFLLGNTYGGNSSLFGLPDLRGRAAVGYDKERSSRMGLLVMGHKYGRELTNLEVDQLPSHTHQAVVGDSKVVVKIPVVSTAGAATTNVPDPSTHLATTDPIFDLSAIGGNASPANIYSATTTPTTTLAPFFAQVTTSGGGLPVSVVNKNTGAGTGIVVTAPRVAMRWCIVTAGDFPPRSD
jgi:microcystin-dependent protein